MISILAGLIAISALLIIWTPVSNWLSDLFFVKNEPRKSDAIIVLSGGAYPNGILSLFTIGRVTEGIILYKKGFAKKIIFVGDSKNNRITDAQKMSELAVQLGVPGQDILTGEFSSDTHTDLLEAKKVMDRENLNRALIVTSSTHTLRTSLVAKKINLNGIPVVLSADKYRQDSVDRIILFWFELREMAALVIFKLRRKI